MITIHNLQKNFGEKRAVDIESYTVKQGDWEMSLSIVQDNGKTW